MSTLKAIVMYASKYGFTKGIAEFIGEKLLQKGIQAEVGQVDAVYNPSLYDAFVIRGAVPICTTG
jgi:menaquinone-dependent protoporphyrinogen oxidase